MELEIILASANVTIANHINTGCSLINIGPGVTPCRIRAPRTIAHSELPGIPKAILGSAEPDSFASFEASGARTPSGLPLPKESGSLLEPRAAKYAIKAATVPPMAGTTPIMVPIDELLIRSHGLVNTYFTPLITCEKGITAATKLF